jgi:hypothetical protein
MFTMDGRRLSIELIGRGHNRLLLGTYSTYVFVKIKMVSLASKEESTYYIYYESRVHLTHDIINIIILNLLLTKKIKPDNFQSMNSYNLRGWKVLFKSRRQGKAIVQVSVHTYNDKQYTKINGNK